MRLGGLALDVSFTLVLRLRPLLQRGGGALDFGRSVAGALAFQAAVLGQYLAVAGVDLDVDDARRCRCESRLQPRRGS